MNLASFCKARKLFKNFISNLQNRAIHELRGLQNQSEIHMEIFAVNLVEIC